MDALQALRDVIGKPVVVTSGYRCPAHNKTIGGAPNSLHLSGMAADVKVEGVSSFKIAELAEMIPAFENGGIGIYKRHTHLDIRGREARWAG